MQRNTIRHHIRAHPSHSDTYNYLQSQSVSVNARRLRNRDLYVRNWPDEEVLPLGITVYGRRGSKVILCCQRTRSLLTSERGFILPV